mmetsp:Transcript_34847/g.53496  ORF Transcript_34847/g.53496 Transcript_34847/m.53496 type:complete len:125 (+) Transcript_34847:225-599(+)
MMIEKFFFHSLFGEIFQNAIGTISVITSLAFVVLSYTDWSEYDDNCIKWKSELYDPWAAPYLDRGFSAEVIAEYDDFPDYDFEPKCNEFFYSRMPPQYELVDYCCALVYLFYYFINLFISPNRC